MVTHFSQVAAMKERNYLHANDIYLKLAIGNSPWPIGVTQVRQLGCLIVSPTPRVIHYCHTFLPGRHPRALRSREDLPRDERVGHGAYHERRGDAEVLSGIQKAYHLCAEGLSDRPIQVSGHSTYLERLLQQDCLKDLFIPDQALNAHGKDPL